MTSINKDAVSAELQAVVDRFNQDFKAWMDSTGCRANFQWKYGLDRNVKEVEVQSIDLIVFRKDAPKFEQMKEAMEKSLNL